MQANDKSRLEIVAQGGIDAVQRSITLHQDNAEVRVCIAPKSADATAFARSPTEPCGGRSYAAAARCWHCWRGTTRTRSRLRLP
jgi:hypothetical protein